MQNLSCEDYLKIKKTIIRKLYTKRAFTKGHMLLERLQSGMPPHLTGFVSYILKDLIKQRIVKYYGSTLGMGMHTN